MLVARFKSLAPHFRRPLALATLLLSIPVALVIFRILLWLAFLLIGVGEPGSGGGAQMIMAIVLGPAAIGLSLTFISVIVLGFRAGRILAGGPPREAQQAVAADVARPAGERRG